MSDLEEQRPMDWQKDTSSLTYHHHLSRFSELSKDHFLDDLLEPPNYHQVHIAQQRQRSKVNSKNYRERKKGRAESIRRQIEALEQQNSLLRAQKYCRWCNRPFDHQVLVQKQSFVRLGSEKGPILFDKPGSFDIEHQFQKPELSSTKKEEKRGKIWMALGILMLVLGVTLHGFDGDGKVVRQIELQKQQVDQWVEQMNSAESEYLEVRMAIREQHPLAKLDPGQLKIIYRTEEGQGREPGRSSFEEDRVSINKELLLGIQAQIDDVGFYL